VSAGSRAGHSPFGLALMFAMASAPEMVRKGMQILLDDPEL
jgi:hypothetical protein